MERPDEFGIAPSADPVGGVGRNVGAGKDTEWRFQFATAGQQLALVFMVRMTAGATGGVKQVLSPFDIAVGKGRRRRNYQDGCGQTNQPALMKHGFRDYFFLPEGLMASNASILRHRLILCTEGLHIAAFGDLRQLRRFVL